MAAFAVVLAAADAAAQSATDPVTVTLPPMTTSDQDVGSRYRIHAMLLGGVTGVGGSGLHPFAGAEAGAFRGRFGVLAIGQYGDGNGFRSILLAGGPAIRLADVGYASISAYAGLARYDEGLDSRFSRDVTGPYGALTARVPLPLGAIGVTLSVWRGTLDDVGFESPATITGHRLSVGVGL